MTGYPHVGVLLPSRQPGSSGNPGAAVVAAARAAEAEGFDSVWVGDSLVARPRLDPLAALAAIAAVTTRVRIGSAVLLGALRAPLPTAQALSTIDLLSDGRLIVGLGAGASVPATESDFAAAGADYQLRVRRLYETTRIWRAAWSGEPVPTSPLFPGLGGQVLTPAPAQPGGPPLWLAGEGPRTLRRAGRDFDGWLPFSASPEAFAAGASVVREAGATRAPIVLGAYLTVTVDDDVNVAIAEQTAFAEAYYGVPYDFMRAVQGYCAGTASEVADWLGRYVDRGASHLVLRLAGTNFESQLGRAADVARQLRAHRSAGTG